MNAAPGATEPAPIGHAILDSLVPFQKPALQPSEAAACLGGRSKDFVYDLIAKGSLETIGLSAKGTRTSYIVTRRSVLLYLAARANFDRSEFHRCLDELLAAFDSATLGRVLSIAADLRGRCRR